MQERVTTMQGGGLAGTVTIMCFSLFSGLIVSASQAVSAWLGDMTQGQAAFLGTIIVGIFAALLRTGFDYLKWRYERRGQKPRTKRRS
ncbi:MAG TPA: hypothetical protein VF735_06660 [Pyrinomonadaceae bacterium]